MNVSSGAVPTRLGKRKVGRRDSLLWDLIVNNNDDICFTHILPRLNGTDLKFLYGVNTETRALIKRSSRAGDLKKRFRVREMSSISTLEFAWENKSWWSGYLWNETSFCLQVAKTNKLELLKWAREEKKCKWDLRTATWAHQNGHLHILEYLIESKFDKYDEVACQFAAGNGLLDFLKYLRETAKAPWNYLAVRDAHYYKQPECLQYLLDNNCPIVPGWRYEHGTLYDSEDEEIY